MKKLNENEKIFYTLKEMINKNLLHIENYYKFIFNENFKNDITFLINIKCFFYETNKNINENYLFIEFYYLKVNELKEIENILNKEIELYIKRKYEY